MKIKNSILAIFVAATTATISVSAEVENGIAAQRIFSSQSSEQLYLESYEIARAGIDANLNQLNSSENPKLSSDFLNACGDRNLEDIVIVRNGTRQEIDEMQFVCKVFLEESSVSERTFVLLFKDGKVDDISAVYLSVSPKVSKNRLTFKSAVKHSLATLVSVYLSAKAAQRMFPGEHDKVSHARWSSVLTAAGGLVGHYVFDMDPTKAVLFGAGSAWLVGFGREVKQGVLRNDPNNTNGTWSDVRANQAGILIASIALRLSF